MSAQRLADLRDVQQYVATLAVIVGVVLLVLLVALLCGIPNVIWPAAMVSLLFSHIMTAYIAMGRIAQLENALYMRNISLRMREP